MAELEHLLPVQNVAGETPIWIPQEQALYFVDIEGDSAFRLDAASGEVTTYPLPMPITSLGRRAAGGWITATKEGLALWDHATGNASPLVDPEADNPDCRFNDGAVDRQGRFVIGTLNQTDLNAPDGCLYRYDPDGTIHKIDTGYAVANGIAFSPDGESIYITDMFHGRILAADYDTGAGTISNRRTFVDIPADAGLPDGLIADARGGLWSAHWGGWRVTRYTPEGKIDREIRLPAANVTCMALGGENLTDLYITTAHFFLSDEERAAQPQAGDLFRIQTDVPGLEEPQFAG